MKVFFIPLSVAGGFLAGFIGKKAFEGLWAVIDDSEPPDSEHRDARPGKLVAALALEGAIFGVTRGLADHAARRGFERLTGTWPGEEEPDPA